MEERDRDRLQHILAAARRARQLVEGRSRSALDEDDVLGFALTHLLEILGEAAKAVTPATRGEYVDIPWNEMAATRDRLIHGYFSVDLDIIWTIIESDLPAVIESLKRALAGNGE